MSDPISQPAGNMRPKRSTADTLRPDPGDRNLESPDEPDTGSMPHPLLEAYYADRQQRRDFLGHIFDEHAADYDWTEKLVGFGSGPWYRREALKRAGLVKGMRVIDVGFGTGLVAREALAIVGDPALITGIDPSAGMIAQADVPEQLERLIGRAEAIPLPDGHADFLCMGFALRHVDSLEESFAEFHRVLKPGGSLCLLEITPPANRAYAWALRQYMWRLVPLIARLGAGRPDGDRIWRYYWDTVEACVSPARILAVLAAAGFDQVHRHVELGIFSEYRATRCG